MYVVHDVVEWNLQRERKSKRNGTSRGWRRWWQMTERKRAIFRANFYGCHVNASCGYILFGEFFKIYIYIIPTLNCFKENRLTYNVDACARSLAFSFLFVLAFLDGFSFFFLFGAFLLFREQTNTHSHTYTQPVHTAYTQSTLYCDSAIGGCVAQLGMV